MIEQRAESYRYGPSGVEEIDNVVANVGSAGGLSLSGSATGPHLANVTLLFPDYEVRPRPSAEIIADIREDLTDIPGAEISVEKEEHGPPTGGDVTIRVIGEDFRVLEELSDRIQSTIAGTPGLVNLRSDLEATRPELAFRVDRRRAMLLGVNTAIVGNFLKTCRVRQQGRAPTASSTTSTTSPSACRCRSGRASRTSSASACPTTPAKPSR